MASSRVTAPVPAGSRESGRHPDAPVAEPGRTEEITGWGRFPVAAAEERRSEDLLRLTFRAPLTRGLGRAYGDAALPGPHDRRVANSTLANRILEFDPDTGVLTAEAGLSLDEIYRIFLPRGWFTPVSPGTRFVTLGGMVASDVHGKNHHRDGTIGQHVESLTMRVASGDVVTCSRLVNPDLFRATLGGMGLTGHVLSTTLKLHRVPSPWIVAERERIPDIAGFVSALEAASRSWPMTAGWIDCLSRGRGMGRGVLYRGRWATRDEAPGALPALRQPIPVPFTFPHFVLGPLTVRAFNALHYRMHTYVASAGRSFVRTGSSIRSTRWATGTGCTAGAASSSTSACCPRKPGQRPPPGFCGC